MENLPPKVSPDLSDLTGSETNSSREYVSDRYEFGMYSSENMSNYSSESNEPRTYTVPQPSSQLDTDDFITSAEALTIKQKLQQIINEQAKILQKVKVFDQFEKKMPIFTLNSDTTQNTPSLWLQSRKLSRAMLPNMPPINPEHRSFTKDMSYSQNVLENNPNLLPTWAGVERMYTYSLTFVNSMVPMDTLSQGYLNDTAAALVKPPISIYGSKKISMAELLIAHNGLLSILEGFMLISDTYQDTYVQEITGMTSVQHAIQKLRRLIAQGDVREEVVAQARGLLFVGKNTYERHVYLEQKKVVEMNFPGVDLSTAERYYGQNTDPFKPHQVSKPEYVTTIDGVSYRPIDYSETATTPQNKTKPKFKVNPSRKSKRISSRR